MPKLEFYSVCVRVFRPKLVSDIAEVIIYSTRRLRLEHSGFKSNEVNMMVSKQTLNRLDPQPDPHFLSCGF